MGAPYEPMTIVAPGQNLPECPGVVVLFEPRAHANLSCSDHVILY